MKRFLFSFLSYSSLITLAFSTSCERHTISIQEDSSQTEAAEQLQSVVDAYFESYLKLNPLFATSIGDHRFDDQMTIDISLEYREKEALLTRTFLEQVRKIGSKKLSGQDLITYEMFVQDLQALENLQKVDLSYLLPFNQFDSFFLTLQR